MEVIIGIDIGTTKIKVCAYNRSGDKIADLERRNKKIARKHGINFDGDYIWLCLWEMFQEVISAEIKISAIGLTSLGETVIPAHEDFSQGIVWHDSRTEKISNEFFDKISEKNYFALTGLRKNHIYSIFKILWYYKNNKELFDRAEKFLPINSYIGYKLTGEMGLDYSQASRTGGFSLQSEEWSEEIFKNLPFSEEVFPEFLGWQTELGYMRDNLQRELDISYDVPVVLAGHDHICGAYAAGIHRGHKILDSMGTSESMMMVKDKKKVDIENLYDKEVECGHYVLPGKFYIFTSLNLSGGLIDELISLFFGINKKEIREKDYRRFIEEASKFHGDDPECEIYVEANESEKKYRLQDINILKLRENTDRGEVFLTSLNYLCRKSLDCVKILAGLIDYDPDIICIGGGTQNRLLMKIKAENFPFDQYIYDSPHSAALGAALQAGRCSGAFDDEAEFYRLRDSSLTKVQYHYT